MALDKNLKNLQILLSSMEQDHLTKKDFVESFSNVVKRVKMVESKLIQDIQEVKKTLTDFNNKLKGEADLDIKKLKSEITNAVSKKLNEITLSYNRKVKEIENKLSDVKDGKDADEEIIVNKVISKIEIPEVEDLENNIPKLGTQIRDALELLQGEERLDMDAIAGLSEALEELRGIRKLGGGGGFSKIAMEGKIIDDETPTGTINGTNKIFTLASSPNPISSLKVYRGGARQRITEDYTLSGKTITFTIAPVSGEVILCDYRV
jgi:hypothetical protein